MPLVIDASVALAWCFEDEATPETEAVLDLVGKETAVVPPIWELEMANVLLGAEKRGRLSEFQTARFVSLLGQLPIMVDSAPSDIKAVIATGRRHGLTSYDATYLLLAEREGLELATLDAALVAAAETAGVPLTIQRLQEGHQEGV
ncbi:type II toxin-antitoxin system VapC family toxin [Sphaerimonospora thailandensis]|uniref:Ribonuclease VapC n=1 Tax=Sphaerimonospora thailandensis TaxID=795644 RepID=A0A8J3R8F0_9ACTN|nr:type II toxin-antitoxin system VapC family toxin [Sphaerimonospora thailandensis]GIH69267.1 twitching motility protein PilT [Sphaerimonospora thailandensis]